MHRAPRVGVTANANSDAFRSDRTVDYCGKTKTPCSVRRSKARQSQPTHSLAWVGVPADMQTPTFSRVIDFSIIMESSSGQLIRQSNITTQRKATLCSPWLGPVMRGSESLPMQTPTSLKDFQSMEFFERAICFSIILKWPSIAPRSPVSQCPGRSPCSNANSDISLRISVYRVFGEEETSTQ